MDIFATNTHICKERILLELDVSFKSEANNKGYLKKYAVHLFKINGCSISHEYIHKYNMFDYCCFISIPEALYNKFI